MHQTISRQTASPARWQAALARALDEGVQLYQVAGSGECVATSASKPGTVYRTDGRECECEAAQLASDPVCKHRALYWHRLGLLDLDPEPEPPTPAAPTVRCQTCGDTGFVTKVNSLRPDLTYQAACRDCRTVVDLAPFLATKYGRASAAV